MYLRSYYVYRIPAPEAWVRMISRASHKRIAAIQQAFDGLLHVEASSPASRRGARDAPQTPLRRRSAPPSEELEELSGVARPTAACEVGTLYCERPRGPSWDHALRAPSSELALHAGASTHATPPFSPITPGERPLFEPIDPDAHAHIPEQLQIGRCSELVHGYLNPVMKRGAGLSTALLPALPPEDDAGALLSRFDANWRERLWRVGAGAPPDALEQLVAKLDQRCHFLSRRRPRAIADGAADAESSDGDSERCDANGDGDGDGDGDGARNGDHRNGGDRKGGQRSGRDIGVGVEGGAQGLPRGLALLASVLRLFRERLALAALWHLLSLLFEVLQPIILASIIRDLSHQREQVLALDFFEVLLLTGAVLSANLMLQQAHWSGARAGVRLKSTISAAVYAKCLKLGAAVFDAAAVDASTHSSLVPPKGCVVAAADAQREGRGQSARESSRHDATGVSSIASRVGKLISEDVSTLEPWLTYAHSLWAAPLHLSVVLIIVSTQVGFVAMLPGLIIVSLDLHLARRAAEHARAARAAGAARAETRLGTLREALTAVEFIKSSGWERVAAARVEALRSQERHAQLSALATEVALETRGFVVPIVATLFTLLTASAMPSPLRPEQMIATLVLYHSLARHSALFARASNGGRDAMGALRRLEAFLELPEQGVGMHDPGGASKPFAPKWVSGAEMAAAELAAGEMAGEMAPTSAPRLRADELCICISHLRARWEPSSARGGAAAAAWFERASPALSELRRRPPSCWSLAFAKAARRCRAAFADGGVFGGGRLEVRRRYSRRMGRNAAVLSGGDSPIFSREAIGRQATYLRTQLAAALAAICAALRSICMPWCPRKGGPVWRQHPGAIGRSAAGSCEFDETPASTPMRSAAAAA